MGLHCGVRSLDCITVRLHRRQGRARQRDASWGCIVGLDFGVASWDCTWNCIVASRGHCMSASCHWVRKFVHECF